MGKNEKNALLHRKPFFVLVFFFVASLAFTQTSALRDYVGVIHQSYHPDVVEFLDKIKEQAVKRGHGDAAKAIDSYLKGGFGTGFVYVAPDGANYLLTNYHVIAQADKLSITFEKLDGAKTTYDRLRVIAADEDIDLALLAFADNVRPFQTGLAFAGAPAEEGSDVYAAGFPGLGNAAIWQFSRGMISNAAVRLPLDDDEDVPEAALGPYIQHTAQIDSGNSGSPPLNSERGRYIRLCGGGH